MILNRQPSGNDGYEPSRVWRTIIVNSLVGQLNLTEQSQNQAIQTPEQFSRLLTERLLEQVARPGQYLGNEWGALAKPWENADVRLALAFPDLYELGMSNFGLRILYQIVNDKSGLLADRSYAPDSDLELLLRKLNLPLWGWESRKPLSAFELIGFSLQYELTYTNVLNMLDLAGLPVVAAERTQLFPLIFGGGPSSVNPEPMAKFMDFFVIGDGEEAVPQVMERVRNFKQRAASGKFDRRELLLELAAEVPGVYVPSLYERIPQTPVVRPIAVEGKTLPVRVLRQVQPLNDENQPTAGIVPYLALVHDRAVLEVRRGCDRGCRFCQPGYTFLPVRERTADDLVRLSQTALEKSGQQEYSMLSLCVSDYTSLHDAVRALNRQHSQWRASMSFPSQRADRMNLDLAEELKSVRKSGITLAPEAGSERLRQVINKGLNHGQIISAIQAAYQSGWTSVKLYFMLGLPTETDEDLAGIIEILKEATDLCRQIKKANPESLKRNVEFTCTMSNFVPKPFTPFQWFGQITTEETKRRQQVLRDRLKESGLRNVTLNFTDPEISLLEAVISRGDRQIADLIEAAWLSGSTFDAWDDRFKPQNWYRSAEQLSLCLTDLASKDREVGSDQPWDIIHIGLHNWWLVKEWEKAVAEKETAPCTENVCHACGVCTELDATHQLAAPKPEVIKKNPFVKELVAHELDDSHPSLFFMKPQEQPSNKAVTRIRFEFCKFGELRFISHLDLQHLLARAARRAKIAVSFTEGFNPAPKLNLAVSLPIFQEGQAEIGEVDLCQPILVEQFVTSMNEQLPREIQLKRAKEVPLSGASLASVVGRATYLASLKEGADKVATTDTAGEIAERISLLLASPTLEVAVVEPERPKKNKRRKNGATEVQTEKKTRDLRLGILNLCLASQSPISVGLELATGPKLHVKPTEVLKLIDSDFDWRVTRLGLALPDGSSLFDFRDG